MSTLLPKGTNKLLNKYLIKVDGLFKKKYINGKEIYIDNSFNELHNAQSVGEVIGVPVKKEKSVDSIQVGDLVLLHHFAAKPELLLKIEDDDSEYLAVEPGMMYLSISPKGEYKTIGPFCILEKKAPIEEVTKSGIFTGEVEVKDENEGTVIAADNRFIELGGKVGDYVMFDKGGDYDMEMPDGKVYYRVRTNTIYAVLNG